jgi:hypothetical protein
VQLVADKALMDPAAPRSGRVEVTLKDGRTVSHFTRHAPGTPENPLDTESVNAKARALMTPVLGVKNTEAIIKRVNALESLKNVRELRPFLAGGNAPNQVVKKPVSKKAVPKKIAAKNAPTKKSFKLVKEAAKKK